MGSLVFVLESVPSFGIVHLLRASASGRVTALTVIKQEIAQGIPADLRIMREEKMKAMNVLFTELSYVQLGKRTFDQEDLSDVEYYTAGVNWLEAQRDLFPDMVRRTHGEYFEILKAFCDGSYSRDFEKEKAFVILQVEGFVEKILGRVQIVEE